MSACSEEGTDGMDECIAVPAAEEYPYLASFGDDMVPRTPEWQKALIEGIERMGGTGFTYPKTAPARTSLRHAWYHRILCANLAGSVILM